MYLWLGLAVVILAILIWLAWLPLRIRLWVRRQQGDEEGSVEVFYLFGLIRWKRQLTSVMSKSSAEGPSISVNHGPSGAEQTTASDSELSSTSKGNHTELTTEEVWRFLKNWSRWKSVFDGVWPIVKQLLRRMWFRQCQIQITLGTDDVISTGMAYGTAWSLAAGFISPLTYWANFSDKPNIEIMADFQQAKLEGSARCIVEVRLGYAIFAGLRLARVWKSTQAEKEEGINGSSHSGVNADSHGEYSGHD